MALRPGRLLEDLGIDTKPITEGCEFGGIDFHGMKDIMQMRFEQFLVLLVILRPYQWM